MSEINATAVGKRIFDIRKSKKLTQNEFGALLNNVDRSLVSKWEQGKNLPNRERIEEIANLGNISVEELLFGDLDSYSVLRVHEYLEKNFFELRDLPSIYEDYGLSFNNSPNLTAESIIKSLIEILKNKKGILFNHSYVSSAQFFKDITEVLRLNAIVYNFQNDKLTCSIANIKLDDQNDDTYTFYLDLKLEYFDNYNLVNEYPREEILFSYTSEPNVVVSLEESNLKIIEFNGFYLWEQNRTFNYLINEEDKLEIMNHIRTSINDKFFRKKTFF